MHDHLAPRIDLQRTVDLHRQLEEMAASRKNEMSEALCEAQAELHNRGVTFGGERDMAAALSALLLDWRDIEQLRSLTERMHQIVESLLDWLFDSDERLVRYFPEHARLLPYLAPTRGWRGHQVVSRYDVVVTPQGDLRMMELNAGCPAGFLHSQSFSQITEQALRRIGVDGKLADPSYATIDSSALVKALLRMEERSGVRPGLAAALIDENQIMHELDLLVKEFARQSRRAEVIDARELTYQGGSLYWQGQRISLTYNKFRISVPDSRNHCWKVGFEERYRSLLEGLRRGAVVSANNLRALSIAEDKSLLGLFFDPSTAGLFDAQQREFLENCVLWTSRLEDREVLYEGRRHALLDLVRKEREAFVIKPANEGRGYGVTIGRECTQTEWEQLCVPSREEPRVVQAYAAPLCLPVVGGNNGSVSIQPMYLTLGLATICGKYQGVLSRISPSAVTNVAKRGLVQAALCVDG